MIGGYALSCIFTNCLMDRMGGGQFEGFPGNAYILQNCTWHGGWLSLTPSAAISLVVRDSAFDGTCVTLADLCEGSNRTFAQFRAGQKL
jgi:hypothetical protein